ncbi:acyltransferase family protein [Micromonospora sp. 4G55]|uniref:acyltransferase family protein n=1 Tax=Micromonospora sp. 4G55 TaxID=2806102 RepID=UPI001A4962D1|nr:acyltransferase family protein [Micromonospora sp. 4G55]MBM0255919.1 acyltransferase [Micromonospora sp. 4G55]
MPSQTPSSRLYVLDGLRLVAALLVVGFHFTVFAKPWGVPNGSALPGLAVATQFGWLGVYLFFLISGFVICMSAEGRSVAQFATARITRLSCPRNLHFVASLRGLQMNGAGG